MKNSRIKFLDLDEGASLKKEPEPVQASAPDFSFSAAAKEAARNARAMGEFARIAPLRPMGVTGTGWSGPAPRRAGVTVLEWLQTWPKLMLWQGAVWLIEECVYETNIDRETWCWVKLVSKEPSVPVYVQTTYGGGGPLQWLRGDYRREKVRLEPDWDAGPFMVPQPSEEEAKR